MKLVCRDLQGTTSSYTIESLIRRFLHESFNGSFVYIISPWISLFKFSRPFIHYPFVDTNGVDDVLRALADVVEVKILTRCIDDYIDIVFIKLLRLWQDLRSKLQITASEQLQSYLRERVDSFIETLKLVIRLKDILGTNLLFDSRSPNYGRLHTKLYLNDFSVVLGSANFTKSGIADHGNWECLFHLKKDEAISIYTEALNVARRHFNSGQDFFSCERSTLSLLTKLNLIEKPVASLEELLEYFEDLRYELSAE